MLYSFPLMGSSKSFMFKHETEANRTVKINIDKSTFARAAFEGISTPLYYIIKSYSDEDIIKQDGNDLAFSGGINDGGVTLTELNQNEKLSALPVPYSGICHSVTGKHIEVLLFNGDFLQVQGSVDVIDGVPYEGIVPVPYTANLNGNDLNEKVIDIPDFSYEYRIVPNFTASTIGWPTVTQLGVSNQVASPTSKITDGIVSEDWVLISQYAVGLSILYLVGDAASVQRGEVFFRVRR